MENSQQILEVDPSLEIMYKKLVSTQQEFILRELAQKSDVYAHSDFEGNLISVGPAYAANKFKNNAFVEAFRMAYEYHIPLTLSPDMFWLAIA